MASGWDFRDPKSKKIPKEISENPKIPGIGIGILKSLKNLEEISSEKSQIYPRDQDFFSLDGIPLNCHEKVRDRQKVSHCPAGASGVVPLRKIDKVFGHSQRELISTTLYKLASRYEFTKF